MLGIATALWIPAVPHDAGRASVRVLCVRLSQRQRPAMDCCAGKAGGAGLGFPGARRRALSSQSAITVRACIPSRSSTPALPVLDSLSLHCFTFARCCVLRSTPARGRRENGYDLVQQAAVVPCP